MNNIKPRLCVYSTAIVALLVVSTATAQKLPAKRSQPVAVMRLQGLERVYFEHVAGPGDALPSGAPSGLDGRKRGEPIVPPPFVFDLLPEAFRSTNSTAKPSSICAEPDVDSDLAVRDFRLELQDKRELLVRQIVISRHPRFSELWWALYDGGRRGDVWYFSALPLPDNKILSNYAIEQVVPQKDGFELRIRGTMFRPGGNWWILGKAFVLSFRHSTLFLSKVRNIFSVFHSVSNIVDGATDDWAEKETISVSTETETRGHVQTRTYDAVLEAVLLQCEYRDPALQEDCWDFVWQDWERLARCVTRNSAARSSYRKLNVPSFIERGGSAQK